MDQRAPAPRLLWRPTDEAIEVSRMTAFRRQWAARGGPSTTDFRSLHAASIADPEGFWSTLWDECGVIGEKTGPVLVDGDRMPGARFFPEARLNFAENLLRRGDDAEALVFQGETVVTRRATWRQLNDLVSSLQQCFRAHGVAPGERIAAVLPNMPEAVATMLAAASLGAVFTSCSPDFGERGILDRFGQVAPKILVVVDGYHYAGKRIDIGAKIASVVALLPSVELVLVVDYLGHAEEMALGLRAGASFTEVVASFAPKPLTFERLPFGHPLYILYSSGTTGVPKCIVHSAGGTLLQHLKEHRLHCDIRPGERFFYFTTLGWMMWNWLVSGLASEATLLLYDGSPFVTNEVLFDFAARERMTIFGTSAKYIDTLRKTGWAPKDTHDLSRLRLMTSTGSPLSPEGFAFVADHVKPGMPLASISGGTDIVSCFVGGDPTSPVYEGEIQAPGLGMAVDVWDEEGRPAGVGAKGELVCTRPFPSMPVAFWNDPDGAKYRAAYFERFPNTWCHGDFAEWTPRGGMIIHGRSDATLNPGGVRIGTAEIYAQVERVPEIAEAIAIGQDFEGDVRVVLFVRLAAGAALDDALVVRIKRAIREGASPRHVPAKILAVADIPRTKSGKITELAVREVVHGRPVKNQEALANPEALALFAGLEELKR
jgi:acetoacetyl-CoA synthetase